MHFYEPTLCATVYLLHSTKQTVHCEVKEDNSLLAE